MSTENTSYHYDYSRLDRYLTHELDPQEVGNKLDEIMSELVSYASRNENYSDRQEDHHYVLKLLRNIYWKLEPAEKP